MPVFAVSNLGINVGELRWSDLTNPVTLGVLFGLVPGKIIGISLFTWIALRLRLGKLPKGVAWRELLGIGFLGGIGFTMSLFISNLAFVQDELVESAKIGILVSSMAAGVIGLAWLFLGGGTRSARA